jgi:hypothetical protein
MEESLFSTPRIVRTTPRTAELLGKTHGESEVSRAWCMLVSAGMSEGADMLRAMRSAADWVGEQTFSMREPLLEEAVERRR